jgi:hypothetical protein
MADLQIRVGDLTFTADWEADAPLTRAALSPWLPIRSRLIHCKWSGESTWIRACSFSSRVGPLAGNHFATLISGQAQLAEMGRRVLWGGAQEIEISEGA